MNLDPGKERRQRRSEDPLSALNLQLDCARHEAELDALVLADGAGCLVAGAGVLSTCELLAAHAPFWANGLSPAAGDDLFAASKDFAVQRLSAGGSELLLCAIGGGRHRALSLMRAAAGCRRILDGKA